MSDKLFWSIVIGICILLYLFLFSGCVTKVDKRVSYSLAAPPIPLATLSWSNGIIQHSTDLRNWSNWSDERNGRVTIALVELNEFWRLLSPNSCTVILAWDASPSTNVAGYFAYYGPGSGNYTNKVNVGNVLSCSLTIPIDITNWFVVTAYNFFGLESLPSNEVNYFAKPSLALQKL